MFERLRMSRRTSPAIADTFVSGTRLDVRDRGVGTAGAGRFRALLRVNAATRSHVEVRIAPERASLPFPDPSGIALA